MSLRAGYQQISLSERDLARISTEHIDVKHLRLILKVHSPKEPAGFIDEPAEVFLSYIPGYLSGHEFFSLQ